MSFDSNNLDKLTFKSLKKKSSRRMSPTSSEEKLDFEKINRLYLMRLEQEAIQKKFMSSFKE